MKPNANFKLSKSAKRLIAATADPTKSNQIKRMYVEAELAASVQPRVSRNRKESQGD